MATKHISVANRRENPTSSRSPRVAVAYGLSVLALAASAGCSDVNQMQPNVPNGGRAVAIAVNPLDSTHMIVASESGGLFRTTNRAVDWQQVSGATSFSYADALYVPGQPDVIVAAAQGDMRTVSAGGIWRSADGGTSWTRANVTPPTSSCTSDLAAFAVTAETGSNKLWAGTLCGLAFSTDLGVSWQYVPAATGYNNDKTYAVLATGNNRLKILTDAGVKVSPDGGASWTLSGAGLPSNILIGVHNQIGASPFNDQHLYWAFNYWKWNTDHWEGHIALYRSLDNGHSWSSVIDAVGINRPPFIRVTSPTGTNAYNLFFGDGGCTFERASVANGATPSISGWSTLGMDHCDPADLGFDTDSHTPLLLVGDGGLQKTADGGANWSLTGAAGHGYAALQITEVTGQLASAKPNLYFGTQDNNIWASPDDGASWTADVCCEGFFLGIWPQPLSTSSTKFSGVTCGPCGNFVSGPVLSGEGGFPDPPNNAGNPRLLQPGSYIQNTSVTGLAGNIFDLTTNDGVTWAPRYGFPEDVRDLSKVSGGGPTIFTAVRRPGSTTDGQEIVGIKRIDSVLAPGAPVLSDVAGFGSLGIFATMFAWYKPFGVDPGNPNYLIVPDIVDNVVKKSVDAGATWQPDNTLTSLVTQSGVMKFRSGPFTQISSFGFDPQCFGHILVGTLQAGIFQTFDYGGTWKSVDGSEVIPNVSSFFFHRKGQAVASSYGRGLWTINYRCPTRPLPPIVRSEEPLIYWKGGKIPISQIHNPDACPVCNWVLVDGGSVEEYIIDERSGVIQEVRISGGTLRGIGWSGAEVPVPFRISVGQQRGSFGGDRQLVELLGKEALQISGLLVEKNLLKGTLLAHSQIGAQQLPQREEQRRPRIEVVLPFGGNHGVPVGSSAAIQIRGYLLEPSVPVEILLDGRPIKAQEEFAVNKDGEFSAAIVPILNIGAHTILVRQRTTHGTIQEAYSFNVTTKDLAPREKERQ